MTTGSTKRRVVEDIGTPGKFVHQAWYPDSLTWHDIGDAHSTRREAEAAMRFYMSLGDTVINPPKED